MAKRKKRAGFWKRTCGIRRAVAILLLLGMALLLRMAAQGLPDFWVDYLAESLSSPEYRTTLEDVTFTPLGGVRADRIKLTHSSKPAVPVVVLEHVALHFGWRRGQPLRHWITSLEIDRLQLVSLPPAGNKGTEGLPSFGPVQVRCRQVEALGTTFRDVSAFISSRAGRLNVEQGHLDVAPLHRPPERVTADFSFGIVEGTIHGTANGQLNPTRLVPLLQGCDLPGLAQEIGVFSFYGTPASMSLELDYRPLQNRRNLTIHLNAINSSYRGVAYETAQACIVAGGSNGWDLVEIGDLLLHRPEGRAKGYLTLDFERDGLEFAIDSTIDPVALFETIDILSREDLADWKFGTGTAVQAAGFYAYQKSVETTIITGRVQAAQLEAYTVPMSDVATSFTVWPDRYEIPDLTASLYGGSLNLTGAIFHVHNRNFTFETFADLRKACNQEFLMAVSGKRLEDPGVIDISIELAGNLSTNILRSLHGDGRLQMAKASLFRMPLFVGLTDFLGRNVPGVDFLVSQNDLEARFTVGDYGLHFSRLRIEGNLFSIGAYGDYWFTDHLDFAVKIHLLKQQTWVGKALRVALFPVSKLFEMELRGPIGDPKWAPTTLSLRAGRRGATDEQRGVLPETTTAPGEE